MSEEMKKANRLDDETMDEVVGGLGFSTSAQKALYRHSTGEAAKATTADYRRKQGTKPQATKTGGRRGSGSQGGTGVC
jgi:hypothetical protein